MAKETNQGVEVSSLNAAHLDVEELEKRLEMTTAGLDGDCWMMDCGTFKPPPET